MSHRIMRHISLFLFAVAFPFAPAFSQNADTIFFGGTILTMDPEQPRAEALAVRGGRIVSVGDEFSIWRFERSKTKSVDLKGGVLMPGFIEPHTHPAASASLYTWVDISGFTNGSQEEVLDKLRDAAANTKPGEWILAFGFDPILIPDLEGLTADKLDAISTEHPIFVMLQSMHTFYVNHKAFELAGITDDTPQPGGGGEFIKDADGRLTGVLREAPAAARFVMIQGFPSRDESLDLMNAQFDRYIRAGITTIGVPGLIPGFIPNAAKVIKDLTDAEDAKLRVRTYAARAIGDAKPSRTIDPVARFAELGVKYWYDGSPYTGTMFLDDPYLDSNLMQQKLGIPAGTSGYSMFTPPVFADMLKSAHVADIQISVHTQGDRSTREVVDAFARLLKETPRTDHRHRLEHLALAESDDLKRAAALGLTTSFHVNHVYYYGRALRDGIVGPERAERLMPVGDALRHGHRVTFHTDSPMYPPNPLLTARTAVTRMTREGDVIGKGQAISVDDALRAITINAAWQLFMEKEVGSIAEGKQADLVWLEKDPYTVPVEDLHSIRIQGTWVSGRPTT